MKLEKKEDCDKILTMKISAEDAIYLHFFQKKSICLWVHRLSIFELQSFQ